MKNHLLSFLMMLGAGVGVGCGELAANDAPGARAEPTAAPLVAETAETAPRSSVAGSDDVRSPAAVEDPQGAVAAAASHTCGACSFDQGVDSRGHFKGVRNCCWNVPVIDETGKVSHICIPYQMDCGLGTSPPSISGM